MRFACLGQVSRLCLLASRQHLSEERQQGGIELGAGAALQFCQRRGDRACRLVGALTDHVVIGFGDGDQSCLQRNGLPSEPVGVTRPIPALVMVANSRRQLGQPGAGLHDVGSQFGMLVQQVPFL